MKILDSNFLFGYFVKEDSLHEKCLHEAESLKLSECLVISDVLHEVISIAAVRHDSAIAIEIGERIFENFQVYSPKKQERKAIWLEFIKLSPHRFSYADVALYFFVKNYGAQLVSFDEALVQKLKQLQL
jgi:predicted nucleic acid-binding protein